MRPPYPPSPVIKGMRWAPAESIVRKARGGDNWPMTWADDDHLYTAYGDGNGFEPHIPDKLSMGFARVEEGPGDFLGINIRSTSGERRGGGKAGQKASGLLMVHGTLFLWVRNAGHARLAWSTDHSQTWGWADWTFPTSFGCPTFLNFGKDYANAQATTLSTSTLMTTAMPICLPTGWYSPGAQGSDQGSASVRILFRP